MNIYVFGNGNLSFDKFMQYYIRPLADLEAGGKHFLLCDFRGVDTLMMEWLKFEENVTVFHMGERPRYLPDKYKTRVNRWKIQGGFGSDEERDSAAISACSHFLAVDFNSDGKRTSGTKRNIETCISLGRVRI